MMTAAPPDLAGRLTLLDDPDYELARIGRSFNRRVPHRRPPAVLRADDPADVTAGIRFAADRGWQVSIRSGGHSWAHWPLRDDALLIDLSNLNDMGYDPTSQVATAGPAIRGGTDLAPFLERHGRFFGVGHCADVGLGGFLLQGGMGWNTRAAGWAAESIEAIDVVTATGDLVIADASTNADLFWAARGAGPAFPGVVTRFHLRTAPMPTLRQTTYLFPAELAEAALRWAMTVQHDLSTDVELMVMIGTLPLPPEISYEGPVVLVHALSFATGHDDGGALAPLSTCPLTDHALVAAIDVPATMADELAQASAAFPENHRYAVDNMWSNSGPDTLAPALAAMHATAPGPRTTVLWMCNAPQPPARDMAFSLQADSYVALYTAWTDPDQDDRHQSWPAEQLRQASHLAVGQYVGDADFAVRPDRFMSDDAWERLTAIRKQWDPTEIFAGHRALCSSPA